MVKIGAELPKLSKKIKLGIRFLDHPVDVCKNDLLHFRHDRHSLKLSETGTIKHTHTSMSSAYRFHPPSKQTTAWVTLWQKILSRCQPGPHNRFGATSQCMCSLSRDDVHKHSPIMPTIWFLYKVCRSLQATTETANTKKDDVALEHNNNMRMGEKIFLFFNI